MNNKSFKNTDNNDDFSEMKIEDLNADQMLIYSSNESLQNKSSQNVNKNNKLSQEIIKHYKFMYPTSFAELKLDGFTDSDAVRYIKNNIELCNDKNNDIDFNSYGSSMKFMKILSYQ